MLNIPVASQKTEGPSACISFLGVLIDTGAFELRLPDDKLVRLQQLVSTWSGKHSCVRKDLDSFVGHLSHAATVVSQGRTFLRELYALLGMDRAPYHYIRLTAGAKADILWWKVFLRNWNGRSFFPATAPSQEITSDASGSFGCGAFSRPQGWFQLAWPEQWWGVDITAKELLPVVLAAAMWGNNWRRARVCFRCDNMAVVNLLKSCTSKDCVLMHLLRCLVFYAAYFRFDFVAHVPGSHNTAVDAIFRNNLSLFFSLVPQIPRVLIPPSLLDLLVHKRPNWGSAHWTRLFSLSLARESQGTHAQSTSLAGTDTRVSATSFTSKPSHSQNSPCAASLPTCHRQ